MSSKHGSVTNTTAQKCCCFPNIITASVKINKISGSSFIILTSRLRLSLGSSPVTLSLLSACDFNVSVSDSNCSSVFREIRGQVDLNKR